MIEELTPSRYVDSLLIRAVKIKAQEKTCYCQIISRIWRGLGGTRASHAVATVGYKCSV